MNLTKLTLSALILLMMSIGFIACDEDDNDTTVNDFTPENPSPEDEATNIDLNVTLNWEVVSGDTEGVSFNVYFSEKESGLDTSLVSENQTTTTYDALGLNPQTAYYWKVIAKKSGAEKSSDDWKFITGVNEGNIRPGFFFTSPANNFETEADTMLISGICSDADGTIDRVEYKINNGNWKQPMFEQDTTDETGQTYIFDFNIQQYEYGYGEIVLYGKAYDNDNTPSDIDTVYAYFVTESNLPPNKPELIFPAQNTVTYDTALTLKWTCSDPNIDPDLNTLKYDVFLMKSAEEYVQIAADIADTIIDVTGLELNTSYYWKVVAKDIISSTESDQGQFRTFLGYPVSIPDDNMEMMLMNQAPNCFVDEKLYACLTDGVTSFSGNNYDIISLKGIEVFTDLEMLFLEENNISDIEPLSGLTKLSYLDLDGNLDIIDLSGLANLINLEQLYLGDCFISDLTPLIGLNYVLELKLINNNISSLDGSQNMDDLEDLKISYNRVSDLSVLSNLVDLVELYAAGNFITTLAPLANLEYLERIDMKDNVNLVNINATQTLPKLKYVYFNNCAVTDLSALVNNPNFAEGCVLNASNCPLSEIAIESQIPALRDRGVTVTY